MTILLLIMKKMSRYPSCYEVCSNEVSDKEEKIYIGGRQIIVYKPVIMISEENRSALQFLDLMSTIDRDSEIGSREFTDKVRYGK